eukprot:5025837-Pyramimonas_sp.AAC.1
MIVFTQETHGTFDDLETLRRDFPFHYRIGSFCSTPNAGGVVVSISKRFFHKFSAARVVPVALGRILVLRLAGPAGQLVLGNVHLDPALSSGG